MGLQLDSVAEQTKPPKEPQSVFKMYIVSKQDLALLATGNLEAVTFYSPYYPFDYKLKENAWVVSDRLFTTIDRSEKKLRTVEHGIHGSTSLEMVQQWAGSTTSRFPNPSFGGYAIIRMEGRPSDFVARSRTQNWPGTLVVYAKLQFKELIEFALFDFFKAGSRKSCPG